MPTRRILPYFFLLLPTLALGNPASPKSDSLIWGFGLKLKVDIGNKRTAHYSVSVSGGIGKQMWDAMLFSYHLTATLYRGGLGNSLLPSNVDDHQVDVVNGFAITGGGGKPYRRIRPFYTWSANPAVSFSNPYRNSFTLASNFLWNNHHRSQQIGFAGLALGMVSVGYYNDGTPFSAQLGLGDGFDRFWTGGGYLHIGHDASDVQAIASFDKFTCDSKTGFDVANLMRLRFVPSSAEDASFNRGRTMLTLIHRDGIGLNVGLFDNPSMDIQDFIHRLGRMAYHPKVYGKHVLTGLQYQYFGSQNFNR